ncbi:hypothetical protein AM593_05938, partial [Mytilus galloprovincialis]
LIGGYFLHYLPFFLTDSTLFLHSYLPCVIFKILAATALIDHLYVVSHRFPVLPSTVKYVTVGIILCTIYSFYKLSVFTYGGTDLTPQQITDLMWRESWDFLIHVRV